MERINQILNDIPTNDLKLYEEMGNNAIKAGHEDESMQWYMKGLRKARELKNHDQATAFSHLILTLL